MFLHPEQLTIEDVAYRPLLPELAWRYDLSDYGRQRFEASTSYVAQDRVTGSVRAAIVVGAAIFLALALLAFVTDYLSLLWQHLAWPAGLWAAGVGTVYLYASNNKAAQSPFPLIYTLRLRPDILASSNDPPTYFLTLHCNRREPPLEHAPPLDVVGPLAKLTGFEVAPPPPRAANPRYKLMARFTFDAHEPRSSVTIATWAEGDLAPADPLTPLHHLREQLSWALIENRKTWLNPIMQGQLPTTR